MSRFFPALVFVLLIMSFPDAHAAPLRIVALGDSLTAGYGLPRGEDFGTKLEQALNEEGLDVKVQNAGISGDTTQGGRARLESVLSGEPKPRLVIVALGANDMLRQLPPAEAKENLAAILQILKDREIPAYLIGIRNVMVIGPFGGGPYARIYEQLADEFDVPLFPFFLKGVAMDKALNQADGLHPNEKGVAIMVHNIAPEIADLLDD